LKRRAIILGAIALSGCGGEPPSSWAERASAVCREALDELERLPEPQSDAEVARTIERYHAVGSKMVVRLRRLEPPPAEAKRARDMVDAYAGVVPVLKELGEAIERGDLQRVTTLDKQMQALGSRGDELALELGADECAKEPGDEKPDADAG
jgi:hypothetical protein